MHLPLLSASYMNDFARVFLNEDWESMTGAPRVYVGAFGKHPGWNDHLDDIGLVTGSLVETRRIVYGGGIAKQIESAAWDRAEADKVLTGFNHLLHWRRPGESITGLLWSSKDGKGRSLYPMCVVAHCIGDNFDWIANEVVPALETAGQRCRAASMANSVLSSLDQTQNSLREKAAALPPPLPGGSRLGVEAWARHFSKDTTPLRRVCHELRGQFGGFAPGSIAWCEKDGPAASRLLRLPLVPGAKPAESVNAWLAFLATQLDPTVPLLALVRLDDTWVDVIVGEPTPADFFVLRASSWAVPLTTDIPYQLESESAAGIAGLLGEIAQGRLPSASCLNGQAAEASRQAAAKWLARFRPGARGGFFSRLLNPVSRF